MSAEDSREVYGRLLAAPTVERGVEVCLRTWLGPYLGEVLAQAGHGRHDLPDPSDLVRASDFGWPVESTVALVVVATPGTAADARREPDFYTASWDVRASVLVDLGERLDTREAAQFYAAAAGAALAHKGVAAVGEDRSTWVRDDDGDMLSLAGSSVKWLGETYRQMAQRADRALIAGEARVLVTVEGARSTYGGPDEPPIDAETDQPGRDEAGLEGSAPVDPSLTIERETP